MNQVAYHRRFYQRRATGAVRGFTLIELLVVIGIIAVLISLLFPAFSKVRESSNQIKCLSNLKQIGLAFQGYLNDSQGHFPFGATEDVDNVYNEDWIWWQTMKVLPYDNPSPPYNHVPGRPVTDITQSAIAPYLGDLSSGDILRCPSDIWTSRRSISSSGPYNYSYSMNYKLDGRIGVGNPILSQILHQEDRILIAEESLRTINDGYWVPPIFDANGTYIGNDLDMLSIAHDPPPDISKDTFDKTNPVLPFKDHKGNVAFLDGHAEFVTRQSAHSQWRIHPKVAAP